MSAPDIQLLFSRYFLSFHTMQAVILAAGRGTRMGNLVDTIPKPMLMLDGKTLLEHKFDILPEDVNEIVIVIGYLGDVIKNRFGAAYNGRKITYVTQENIVGGTADALWAAKDVLTDRFVVLMGDDVYVREDIEACRVYDWAILVKQIPDLGTRGKVIVDIDNRVIDILEHENHSGGEGLAGTNMFVLDTRIFKHHLVPRSEHIQEFGLPQTVADASKALGISLHAVPATWWEQITGPEDIDAAVQALRERVTPTL